MAETDVKFEMITDTKQFSMDMHRLTKQYGVGVDEVMRDQMRLWTNDVIKMTPPKTLAQGRGAVIRDLNMIFSDVKDREVMNFFEDLDDRGVLPSNIVINAEGNLDEMEERHNRTRTRRGRVTEHMKHKKGFKLGKLEMDAKMYVPRSAFNKYKKKKTSNVGITKAGWLGGGNPFNSKAPAFVMKQKKQGEAGGRIDKKGNGKLWVQNNIPWASRLEHLFGPARRTRERDMKKHLEKRIQNIADKNHNQSKSRAA